MHSDNAIADQLVDLGVATLHEALGRRNLPAGLTLLVGEPFAGQAVTVGLPAGDNLGVHLALEVAEPGSVICAASAGQGLYGVIGEILHAAGQARGIAGFVLDDGVRDVARLRGVPSVAARGIAARGTVKRRVRQAVGADVAIGGALVAAGDWLVCDRDGVCVIPRQALAEVLERAQSRETAEARILSEVATGTSTSSLLGLPKEGRPSVGYQSGTKS